MRSEQWQFIRTKEPRDWVIYKEMRNGVVDAVRKAKNEYYSRIQLQLQDHNLLPHR